MSFSLSDLAKITGAPPRSVQFWADSGALQADRQTERAGSGRHREFSNEEAIIACIVHGLAVQGVTIGKLLSATEALRRIRPSSNRYIQRAINDEGHNIVFFNQRGDSLFWSSEISGRPLEDVIPKRGGAFGFSGVYVVLNAVLAGAREALSTKR